MLYKQMPRLDFGKILKKCAIIYGYTKICRHVHSKKLQHTQKGQSFFQVYLQLHIADYTLYIHCKIYRDKWTTQHILTSSSQHITGCADKTNTLHSPQFENTKFWTCFSGYIHTHYFNQIE